MALQSPFKDPFLEAQKQLEEKKIPVKAPMMWQFRLFDISGK